MGIQINNPGGGGGSYDMIIEQTIPFEVKTANAQYSLSYTPTRNMYVYLNAKWYGATAAFIGTLTINKSSGSNRAVLGGQFLAQGGGNSRTAVRSHTTGVYYLKKGEKYLMSFLGQEATSLTVTEVNLNILQG